MASKYKPSYRRQKTVLTASTKAVIVMLAVLVVTLAVFLIKSVMSQSLKPAIVYPPESSDTNETPARTDTDIMAFWPGLTIRRRRDILVEDRNHQQFRKRIS